MHKALAEHRVPLNTLDLNLLHVEGFDSEIWSSPAHWKTMAADSHWYIWNSCFPFESFFGYVVSEFLRDSCSNIPIDAKHRRIALGLSTQTVYEFPCLIGRTKQPKPANSHVNSDPFREWGTKKRFWWKSLFKLNDWSCASCFRQDLKNSQNELITPHSLSRYIRKLSNYL